MCMNTRDQRLYHYEYRKPRFNNPTYNSNNLFDSLNMFVRNDRPNPLVHSYGRYSLPKESQYGGGNQSELMDYRSSRGIGMNYSTIQNEMDRSRQGSYLTDKDRRYLRDMEQKQRAARGELDQGTMPMSSSRHFDNPETPRMNPQPASRGGKQLNYKLEDTLSRQLQQFQSGRH